MRDFSTVGFLTNASKTIAFTIPLDKPVVCEEIYFDSMNIQIRHIGGGFLINEDVMQSNYSVITELRSMGIFVTITSEEAFNCISDVPLSIYISEAQGVFV